MGLEFIQEISFFFPKRERLGREVKTGGEARFSVFTWTVLTAEALSQSADQLGQRREGRNFMKCPRDRVRIL